MAFPASSRWGAPATCAISLPGRGRPRGRWEDRSMELDPVDRITTDAVGEPGERVFYLQARQGALVCARGRPTCQFCGNPLDPEGHVCPAMNGHGRLGQA